MSLIFIQKHEGRRLIIKDGEKDQGLNYFSSLNVGNGTILAEEVMKTEPPGLYLMTGPA